jgi:hypothetical protein
MSRDFMNYRVRIRFKSYRTLSISRRELRMPSGKGFFSIMKRWKSTENPYPQKTVILGICGFVNQGKIPTEAMESLFATHLTISRSG